MKALVEALEDESEEVRKAVVEALGQVSEKGQEIVIKKLVQRLEHQIHVQDDTQQTFHHNFHIACYYCTNHDHPHFTNPNDPPNHNLPNFHPIAGALCVLARNNTKLHPWSCHRCKRSFTDFIPLLTHTIEHLTDRQQEELATMNSNNFTPAMVLMALTGRDLVTQPIPHTNLNLLPATLPTHPFSHNFVLTGAPWNLSLITDYVPTPNRPPPRPVSSTHRQHTSKVQAASTRISISHCHSTSPTTIN
eukprot:335353-Amphidinium_carterae.1